MRCALVLIILLSTSVAFAQDATTPPPTDTPRLRAETSRPVDADLLRLRGAEAERQALLRDLRVARAAAIEQALEENRLAVEALAQRLAGAILPSERLAIEREIEQTKFEGDLRLVQIQADFARRAGLDEIAAAMESRVEVMRERRAQVLRSQAPVQE